MIPNRIIIHHSLTADGGTVSWDAIRRYHVHTLGWADIGYHFGIELVGPFYQCLVGRPLNVMGAHCAGENTGSVGICFVGNFDRELPRPDQLDLGVRVVRGLIEVLQITPADVYRHHDFAPKSCPGTRFPWEEFVRRLR